VEKSGLSVPFIARSRLPFSCPADLPKEEAIPVAYLPHFLCKMELHVISLMLYL